MRHLTDIEILEYATSQLDDAGEMRAEEHAEECRACRERLRGALYLQAAPERTVEEWNAQTHGVLSRQLQIVTALRAASLHNPRIAARAAKWIERVGKGTLAGARLAVSNARNVGLSSAAWLTEGWSAGLRPAMQGVASPEAEEAGKIVAEGSRLLSEGLADEAMDSAEEAVRLDVRAARSTTLEISAPDGALVRVVVDSRRRRTVVMRSPVEPRFIGALVVLIPEDQPDLPLVGTFESVEGAPYLLAEFDSVPDGAYHLEMESPV